MESYDWSACGPVSSTGEASNPADYGIPDGAWRDKPVIEYIGGTEIGGGFIAGTVVQPAIPSTFTTPTLGLDIRILDDDGTTAPSASSSSCRRRSGSRPSCSNRDHHEVYFAGVPAVAGSHCAGTATTSSAWRAGYYRAMGRVDDAMNLGGIKVCSAELERTVAGLRACPRSPPLRFLRKAAVPAGSSCSSFRRTASTWTAKRSRSRCSRRSPPSSNPLFKIHDVVPIEELPRTASAKVMRRELRNSYGL